MVIFVAISIFDVFNCQISQKLSQLGSLIDIINNSSPKGFSGQIRRNPIFHFNLSANCRYLQLASLKCLRKSGVLKRNITRNG